MLWVLCFRWLKRLLQMVVWGLAMIEMTSLTSEVCAMLQVYPNMLQR